MDALSELCAARAQLRLFPDRPPAHSALDGLAFSMDDIIDAENRLLRFAPLIARLFPETEEAGGVIESPRSPKCGAGSA